MYCLFIELRLTGSKLGCGEGGCGACTVLISRCIDNEIEHRTVNACLAPLCSVDGCHVVTIEGLGSTSKSNLHSTQSRLAELSASQCGFCTPGMVMSLYGTLTSKTNIFPTMQDIEESFDGNLCRCTGYRPILDAAKSFASDLDQIHYQKSSSSSRTSTTFDKCFSYIQQNSSSINQVEFPAKLRDYIPQSIHIKGSMDWYRPVSLNELLHLRHTYPGDQSKLVFGNTTVQIERKFQQIKYPRLIAIAQIKELQEIKRTADSLYFGAGVTFTRLKTKLIEWNDDNAFCQALLDQLKRFASTQIRNVASLGGNIIAASPM
jgi:xanthine dehydrogenase/oxidase